MTAIIISQGFIKDLYLLKIHDKKDPALQILAFQVSEFNPKEIIIRVSDRECFVDCLLVGPYSIQGGKIISSDFNHANQSFSKYDVIRIADYFCKIDDSKMCRLKIIIRKIFEGFHAKDVLGKPEEVSQFIENNFGAIQREKQVIIQPRCQNQLPSQFSNPVDIPIGTIDIPIKIEEISENVSYFSNTQLHQMGSSQKMKSFQKSSSPQTIASNNTMFRREEDPLNLQDIMSNKPGFFIGRLVRMKFGVKEAKDGPMSFLYLGLVDSNGELVRINMAGRSALKESKELKRQRCYFIKGLELFHGDKGKPGLLQIRLKQKEYKIHEVQNEMVCSKFKNSYFHWDHEEDSNQFENVDVIGVIDSIEQKITYKHTNTFQDQRDVVRVVIRNIYKTVKISFWAEQIKSLQELNLQIKQHVMIEDIKKKKSIFLDYTAESHFINLDEEYDLMETLAHLLPSAEQLPPPENVKQLNQIFELEPNNSKIRMLDLFLVRIDNNKIIYKMCNQCKKKVERILDSCPECKRSEFVFKYNCQIDFADALGTINCVAFDHIAEKIFHKTSEEISLMSYEEAAQFCEMFLFQEYRVGIENKNSRLLIRSLDTITKQLATQKVKDNIQEIITMKQAPEFSILF